MMFKQFIRLCFKLELHTGDQVFCTATSAERRAGYGFHVDSVGVKNVDVDVKILQIVV